MASSRNWTLDKCARIATSTGGFEAGAGASDALPVGVYSGYTHRALLSTTGALDTTGATKVIKATLWVKTSYQHYYAFSADPDVLVQRLTSSWTEGTAVALSSSNSVTWTNQPTATATNQSAPKDLTVSENVWQDIDITDLIEDVLPASIQKRSGAACGANTWYGIRIIHVDAGDATEFYSDDSSYDPYIKFDYETNRAPTAPTLVSPIGGVRIADTTPDLKFIHNDPDGDSSSLGSWELGTSPTLASPEFIGDGAYVVANGATITVTSIGPLTRGTTWYWHARTTDTAGLQGPWSAIQSFRVNALPTATKVRPTASQFAYIWNLEDLAVWTSGGSHAKPEFDWTFADADGGAQSAFRVKVYSASGGGSTLHDSGKVVSSATLYDANWAAVMGTEYWWTIEVWDDLDDTSGESSRTAFKMRWGQAIYEFNAGAGSSGWAFSSPGVLNGEGAFIYSSATGTNGTGRGAWRSSIGTVTPAAYVNILARLQPIATPGSTPTLADMTFSYLGSASTPDRWAISGSGAMVLDSAVRRVGSQSLRFTTGAGNAYIYPYRKSAGDDIPVVANTTYTFSAWVRTDDLLSADLRLTIYAAGGGSSLFFSPVTRDTRSFPESWQRLQVTFKTSPTTAFIRPVVHYLGTTAGEDFWADALKLEEGTLASAWAPGMVGDAMVLDANGMAVDGAAGGIARFRAVSGGTRDQIELGAHGWLFTDVELWSPSAEVLRIGDGLAQQVLEVDGPASGTSGGRFKALGAGANTDAAATNDSGDWLFEVGGVNQARISTDRISLQAGLAWSTGGTTFPGTPTTGWLYYRTDLRGWYFYDGTRWLSEELHRTPITGPENLVPYTGAPPQALARIPTYGGSVDLWLETLVWTARVNTTNDGTNFWTMQFRKVDSNTTTVISTVDTSALAINSYVVARTTVNALMGVNVDVLDWIVSAKTGTPGSLQAYAIIEYRRVAT